MEEMSFEYWNKLADQIIVISSLLGGFPIAVIAIFLVYNVNTRLSRSIVNAAVLAVNFLLISVFAKTKVLMMTTEGCPLKVSEADFKISTIIGGTTLLSGIISLITMIGLSGWAK